MPTPLRLSFQGPAAGPIGGRVPPSIMPGVTVRAVRVAMFKLAR